MDTHHTDYYSINMRYKSDYCNNIVECLLLYLFQSQYVYENIMADNMEEKKMSKFIKFSIFLYVCK